MSPQLTDLQPKRALTVQRAVMRDSDGALEPLREIMSTLFALIFHHLFFYQELEKSKRKFVVNFRERILIRLSKKTKSCLVRESWNPEIENFKMIGRESETLKPVKWLKIENSETDEEDSALGISSGASSSSELGQERFFMIFFQVR
jgi:hypothetical protein